MPRSVRAVGPKILIGLILICFVACHGKASTLPGDPPIKVRDGGTEPGSGGGCGCHVTNGGNEAAAPLGLLMLGVILARARRRRR